LLLLPNQNCWLHTFCHHLSIFSSYQLAFIKFLCALVMSLMSASGPTKSNNEKLVNWINPKPQHPGFWNIPSLKTASALCFIFICHYLCTIPMVNWLPWEILCARKWAIQLFIGLLLTHMNCSKHFYQRELNCSKPSSNSKDVRHLFSSSDKNKYKAHLSRKYSLLPVLYKFFSTIWELLLYQYLFGFCFMTLYQ
jgi:hypothetical protein